MIKCFLKSVSLTIGLSLTVETRNFLKRKSKTITTTSWHCIVFHYFNQLKTVYYVFMTVRYKKLGDSTVIFVKKF